MKKLISIFAIIFFTLVSFNLSYSQWVASSNGIEGKNISQGFTYNNEIWVGVGRYDYLIYKSTNGGNSWLLSYDNDYGPIRFAVNNNYVFYLGRNYWGNEKIFLTSNNGINWIDVTGSFNYYGIKDLIAFNNELFIACYEHGVYKSISGVNWTLCSNGLNSLKVQALGKKDNFIFVGTRTHGIAVSSNAGTSWEPVNNGLNNLDVRGFCPSNDGIFAYTDKINNGNGVYVSTNYGQLWNYKGLEDKDIRSMERISNTIFALVYNEGIYRTTNDGDTWDLVNDGLTNLRASHIISNDLYLYYFAESNTGTDKTIWKRLASELIGIKLLNTSIPSDFSLSQNYPNPFNPSTKIKFDIPKNKCVTLKIYDILGKEVATLVNEKLSAGSYEVNWNASEYSSGVYFCKLISNEFSKTIKLTLVK